MFPVGAIARIHLAPHDKDRFIALFASGGWKAKPAEDYGASLH